MIEPTFLTHEEIKCLTGRIRSHAQFDVLSREGIPATKDGDGKPIVNRKIYETLHLSRKRQRTAKPNLDAI